MKLIFKSLSALAFSLGAFTALATPTNLITNNTTNEESNAYINGTNPSPYPTKAKTTKATAWNLVRLACYGLSTDNKCSATIYMATNTANPIKIGTLTMDLLTGTTTPQSLSANGYTITVKQPSPQDNNTTATISKN